ncbi:50S ribosomal protein L30 [Candidatus Parabeggiatoa sp. HSG14]|uniref:50S ribosomal protein L30 n=1 Tax=Candidatus Parabeggiatoa sp. HSG14 TaxID=3055593 RepID=UPI0025A80597|nr:50S ribosomal protein L30 [Thiotrichales bacterium HSG14]
MNNNEKKLKITQMGSIHGRKPKHKACVIGLGLRHRHHTVVIEDTQAIRGMINRVAYLLKVEEL